MGQYVLQILAYYGYCNVIATASRRNFDLVKESGAAHVVSYDSLAADLKRDIEAGLGGIVDLVIDCIGNRDGSVQAIAGIAEAGAKVAVMLPVVVRDASENMEPEYAMEVEKVVRWREGVEVKGVRTHFYLDVSPYLEYTFSRLFTKASRTRVLTGRQDLFLASHLQPEIMPTLLAQGVIRPNKQKFVEGATLLQRAQKALDILRRKEVSGERLVWRVAQDT